MRSLIGRAAIIFLLALSLAYVTPGAHADEPATFVGGEVSSGCHAAEAERWKGSHHALAMQKATQATVLGDFAGAQLEHFGVSTTFFRDGEKFMVRTDGPDGALHEYEIAYTFGVYPLQQYLIALPGGRLQALAIAWDSRPKDQGGQRWFHLYPNLKLKPGDPLHWTGRDQTWNYQCADCHSTDLKKNYDLAANTYATSWTDLDVSCEACHGPGSRHVAWASLGRSRFPAICSCQVDGALLGCENTTPATPTLCFEWKATWPDAPARALGRPGAVADPSMCVRSLPGRKTGLQ